MPTTTLLLLCLSHLAISIVLAVRLRSLGRDMRQRLDQQQWLTHIAHERCDRRRAEIRDLMPVVEATRDALASYRIRMTAMEGLPSRVVDVERIALDAADAARDAVDAAKDAVATATEVLARDAATPPHTMPPEIRGYCVISQAAPPVGTPPADTPPADTPDTTESLPDQQTEPDL